MPLFLSLNVSGRLLVGSSDAKRVFYHSLGKVVYTGIVDKETYLRYGKCSLAKYDGSQVEVRINSNEKLLNFTVKNMIHLTLPLNNH